MFIWAILKHFAKLIKFIQIHLSLLWKQCKFRYCSDTPANGIYDSLPFSKCLIIDINLSNIAFSMPFEINFLYHGYDLTFMDFEFTKTSRTLKKVSKE